MKLLPIILLLSGIASIAQPLPPMPPDVPQKPRGHTSITDAENAIVRAKQNAAKPAVVHFSAPKPQPAVQRVLDEVARQKANPVKPAPMTPHPTLGARSPRDREPLRKPKP